MTTINPGDIVRHIDGTLARVTMPATERDPRIGVAFWLDDEDVMEMAWCVDWCDAVWEAEAAPGCEWNPVQMNLWAETG